MKAKYEIYINYKLVDLPDDIDVPLTLQTYDITTFGSISSDHSKTIKLPVTENNRSILGHSDFVASGSNIPYRRLPIKVMKGGLEIISRGWCYIVQSDSEYFEITLFYGNYDFMIAIENKRMSDLLTPELDHDINWYNIFHSSFEQYKWSKVYIYPLIEWGDGTIMIEDNLEIVPPYINPGEDINAERLLPVLKVKYIIEQIIIQAGYTLVDVDNLLDYYDNKYINLTNLADDTTSSQIRYAESEIASEDEGQAWFHHVLMYLDVVNKPFWWVFNIEPSTVWMDFFVLQFKDFTKNYFNQIHNFNMYYDLDTRLFTRYKVAAPCQLKMRLQMTLSGAAIPGFHGEIYIGFAVHDGFTYKLETPSDEYDQFAPKYPNYLMLNELLHYIEGPGTETTVDIDYTGSFQYGDYISVVAYIKSWPEGAARILYVKEANLSFDFPETIAKNTGYGYHLTLGQNLPEMLQKDFFKHLVFFRNIVVSTNYYDKIVYFNKLDKVFDNWRDAKNWTNKIDMGNQGELSCIPETFFKRNYFRYSTEDEALDFIGAGYFDIDNQNLETSDEFYRSPFYICEKTIIGAHIGIESLRIRMIDYGYNVIAALPRIFVVIDSPYPEDDNPDKYLNYISETEAINYRTQYHIYAYFVVDLPVQTLRGSDDMDFAKILPKYHYRLIDILQRYKNIKPIIILDDTDILNFNPLLPVRLDQYGAYFYCNTIIDYIDGSTKVELIKLF